jgi:hypothetical protein
LAFVVEVGPALAALVTLGATGTVTEGGALVVEVVVESAVEVGFDTTEVLVGNELPVADVVVEFEPPTLVVTGSVGDATVVVGPAGVVAEPTLVLPATDLGGPAGEVVNTVTVTTIDAGGGTTWPGIVDAGTCTMIT